MNLLRVTRRTAAAAAAAGEIAEDTPQGAAT